MKFLIYLTPLLILLLTSNPLIAQQLESKASTPSLQATPSNDLSSGQQILPAKQVSLLFEMEEVAPEDLVDDSENLEDQFSEDYLAKESFELKILVHLFASGNIAKIHAKIGSSPGAGDIVQHSFPFDEVKEEAGAFSFVREGKTVVLGMGEIKGLHSYHVEVVLESLDGKLSEARYYNPE